MKVCQIFDHPFPDNPEGEGWFWWRVHHDDPRPWSIGRVHPRRKDQALKGYQESLGTQLVWLRSQSAWSDDFPLERAILLRMIVWLPCPDDVETMYPEETPDYDNLGKAAQDAANGIIWTDDCQVINGGTIKAWANFPYPEEEIAFHDPGVLYVFRKLDLSREAELIREYRESFTLEGEKGA